MNIQSNIKSRGIDKKIKLNARFAVCVVRNNAK